MEKTDKFKILCIDGGGIKGIYTAKLLAMLEDTYKVKITDCFDMICGTSTGGLIALAASLGKPMSEVVDFYQRYGADIFNQRIKNTIIGDIILGVKQALMNGKYSGNALEKALINVFGNTKISESKNFLCIPSYNILAGRPRVFKHDYSARLDQDNQKKYVDVALATAAAPTYLPVKHLDNDYYIDGGVWANNPILVGLTEYMLGFVQTDKFDGVDILSISSCEVSNSEPPRHLHRAFWSWKNTLFDTYSNGQSYSALFLMDRLKENLKFDLNYYRLVNTPISPAQAKHVSMDDASKKAQKILLGIADDTFRMEKEKVRRFFTTAKSLNPSEYGK